MERQPDNRLIFGQPQSGKTTRVRTMTRGDRCILYYDTVGHDYTDGFVVSGLGELAAAWSALYRKGFRLIYRPRGSTWGERRQTHKIDPEFAVVCDWVKACGDMTFVVDEIERYVDRGEVDDEFMYLLRLGMGHHGVELVAVTHCPQGLGRDVTALSHDFTIFRTNEPLHLAYFVHRCSGVDVADIRGLQRYEYVRYHDGWSDYKICRDDVVTGKTDERLRQYIYDRGSEYSAVAGSGDVLSAQAVASESKDGAAVDAVARKAGTADGCGDTRS